MAQTLFKPAGLPTFPWHDGRDPDCVLSRLLADAPERGLLAWPEGFSGGITHRLDVQTSGAVLVADSLEELVAIRACFGARQLTKTYRFRAARDVSWDVNTVDRCIAHDRKRKQRMIVQRGPRTPHRGRWLPAGTRFERVEGTLWQATMRTGVMHQIRVHAAFVGLPLAGDALYGGGPGGFQLHHVGLVGGGYQTDPVPLPEWASA